jgi:hypothetical protein
MARAARAVIALLLLVGSGCAGAGTAPPSAASQAVSSGAASVTGSGGASVARDACALLTNDEIEAATGVAVTGINDELGLPRSNYCQWDLESGVNELGVPFDRLAAMTFYAGKSSFETVATTATDAEPITGIGDRALWSSDSVHVLKGDIHFAVGVVLHQPGDEDSALAAAERDAEETLAKLIAGRL